MHIGLIGGIGPAATIAYYGRLTSLVRQQGCALDLTIVHADVDDLIRNSHGDLREEQAGIYARLIERLKAAGADCAAITSLGGHFCFAETEALSALPLVSAVTPLDAHFAASGLQTVGLLGTEMVMRTKLYGQLQQTKAVAPEDNLKAVGTAYRDMAVRGTCLHADRTRFFEAGQQLVENQGADAVVLAGTDVNLAFDGFDPGYKVVDALDVHVALLADLATGKRSLTKRELGR